MILNKNASEENFQFRHKSLRKKILHIRSSKKHNYLNEK